jgi:hypothetical protein
MEKALATFRNGRVEFDSAVHWADGTRLEIAPAPLQRIGLDESDWPTTPQEKADWLAWLENVEPFDMPQEELAAFDAELNASKERQKQLLRDSWETENDA